MRPHRPAAHPRAYNVRATGSPNAALSATIPIRPDIISAKSLATLRAHGVVEAYLFGSVSRGEERPENDIDLLVTFEREVSFGERFLLAEALQRISGRPVDLLTDVHPAFAPYILPTLIPLPL